MCNDMRRFVCRTYLIYSSYVCRWWLSLARFWSEKVFLTLSTFAYFAHNWFFSFFLLTFCHICRALYYSCKDIFFARIRAVSRFSFQYNSSRLNCELIQVTYSFAWIKVVVVYLTHLLVLVSSRYQINNQHNNATAKMRAYYIFTSTWRRLYCSQLH